MAFLARALSLFEPWRPSICYEFGVAFRSCASLDQLSRTTSIMASPTDSDTPAQPEAAPATSGREKKEDLRRKAGRPKSVRPTDFEPMAWESSKTKVDRGEVYHDGESGGKAPIGSCLSGVVNGLKAAWGRLNVFEMASVAAFVIVALLGLFFFRSLVHSGPVVDALEDTSLAVVDLPAKGSLLTLNSIEAVWRDPLPGETVRPGAKIGPVVNIALGGGIGYLRVLFRDEVGKIRGDSLVEKVTSGRVAGGATYTGVCSEGYATSMRLIECLAGRLEPWTVQIYESKDYDMSINEWTLIAMFDMPAEQEAKPQAG